MLEQPPKNTKSPISTPKKYDDHPYHSTIGSTTPPGLDIALEYAPIKLLYSSGGRGEGEGWLGKGWAFDLLLQLTIKTEPLEWDNIDGQKCQNPHP